MFTGIIEDIGVVSGLLSEGSNVHIRIQSRLAPELKVDQSVSHHGVCLTVVEVFDKEYMVTAIKETLEKSNLGFLMEGAKVNLERAMKLGDRLDGHLVQGHVDQTAVCTDIESVDGSWLFSFEYDKSLNHITIEKGSVTVNGVSLTVVDSGINTFKVAIIPYTYRHTTFHLLKVNDLVNLEFDVLGKYVSKLLGGSR